MWQRFLALALLALVCDPSYAADPVVVRFSFPFGLPRIAGADNFEAVNKELDGIGRVNVVNQAGDPLAALREGSVDLAVIPSGRLADTKATGLSVFGVPFLFNGVQDASALQWGAVGEAALASLATEGLVGLGYWNVGTQRIVGSQIASLDDLKGKKLRAMSSRQLQASLQQMGASPTSTAFGEIYAALQTGVVDGAEASPATTLAARLYEAGPSLTEQTLVVQVYVVVASQKSWNALPYKVQSVLADKVNATATALALAVPELEARTIGELKERGVKLVSLSAESLKNAREIAYSGNNLIADKQDTLVRVAVNAVRQESQRPLPHNQGLDPVPRPTGATTLFFATDRKAESTSDLNAKFGSQRSEVAYGTMRVDLGDDRAAAGSSNMARIEELVAYASPHSFETALSQAVQAAPAKELFIYVHGYNTSFRLAAETGALLMQDLKFKGVGLVFSWPSDGTAIQYLRDEQEQEVSRVTLEVVLKTVRTIPGLERIHLLAHSMGGRVATGALELIGRDPAEQRPLLYHLILAAPDVYVARFVQAVGVMKRLSKRVTLYASAGDQALACSQLLHDGARAGQAGANRVVSEDIDTVDASNAETASFLAQVAAYAPQPVSFFHWLLFNSCRSGHSYITRNFSVLNDLHSLVTFNAAPEDRILLQKRPMSALWYWEMRRAER